MSDIYAEFGVNNAVMSSSDISEHEENMLRRDVAVRDGDDAITLEPEVETEEENLEESDEQEQEGEQEEQAEGEPEGDPEQLPEAPSELQEASKALSDYADGFSALRDQAIANGLTEAAAVQIEAEYESDKGLSEASYTALEKVGYSRSFVDSFIRGQESIAQIYVNQIVAYAGGQAKFDQVLAHMKASSPESVESLQEAIERQDLKAVRAIINLGAQSHAKKFGKNPTRNVTKTAPSLPAQRKAPQAEGYSSRAEMVKDMSKPEYRLDEKFRAKVEARVLRSNF